MIFDVPVRLSGKIPAPAFKRRRFVIQIKASGADCPQCGCWSSEATDSRRTENGRRRRRKCVKCGNKFTTLESVVQDK